MKAMTARIARKRAKPNHTASMNSVMTNRTPILLFTRIPRLRSWHAVRSTVSAVLDKCGSVYFPGYAPAFRFILQQRLRSWPAVRSVRMAVLSRFGSFNQFGYALPFRFNPM